MIYTCKRCGFSSHIKTHFKRHLENRNKPCKPIFSNITIETMIKELNENVYKYGQNTDKNGQNTDKNGQNIKKDDENIEKKKNYDIVNGKYQCKECKKLFDQVRYLDDHLKRYCKMTVAYNNIYKYNTKTFGKTIYGKDGGDVYIVGQPELGKDKQFYKIGVTVNIYQRMRTYRCGLTIEPKLHYYYPFKNIKKADKDLKILLYHYYIKREIYECGLDILRNIIKKYQHEEDNNIMEYTPEIKDQYYIFESDDIEVADDKIAILEAEMAKVKEEKEAEMALMKAQMDIVLGYTKEQMDFMRNQIEILMKKAGNTTNTDNSITNNNTNNSTKIDNQINIHINGFGKEDLSYITDRHFREWFNGPFSAIPNLVEYIHFNPKKPQNWNAKIPDDKTSKALIYNAEKEMWVKREKKEVINDLVEKSYNMLDTNFEIQKEAKTLDEKGKRKFENFMKIYDKGDKQLDKRYETEIREKLINFKEYHR